MAWLPARHSPTESCIRSLHILGSAAILRFTRGDLLSALLQLDKEDDVNKVLRYFSYEHFYVIYCKVFMRATSQFCNGIFRLHAQQLC